MSNPNSNEGASGLSSSSQNMDLDLEALRKYFQEKLGFSKSESVPAGPPKLENANIESIVKYIKSGECKNIITMAGAGISTSAGIPDFRSPGSGLYDNLAKYRLPSPMAIFEIDYFRQRPEAFFALAKELFPGSFKPTPCHYFIKLLHRKNLLLRHFTQNIDNLERIAGLPDEALVEAHGSFHLSHCLTCRQEYSLAWMKERIFSDVVPSCDKCNGLVKPDIVFFGENLPSRYFHRTDTDFPKADLLLIMGTSLVVQPFCSLVNSAPPDCPRLLINKEKVGTGPQNPLMGLLGLSGEGLAFDSESNVRDVFLQGDCDSGCQTLADMLGWGEELKQLISDEHARLDLEIEKDKQQRVEKTLAEHTKPDESNDEEGKSENRPDLSEKRLSGSSNVDELNGKPIDTERINEKTNGVDNLDDKVADKLNASENLVDKLNASENLADKLNTSENVADKLNASENLVDKLNDKASSADDTEEKTEVRQNSSNADTTKS